MRGEPVSRILSGVTPSMTIPLGLHSRAASSRQPGPLGAKLPCPPALRLGARGPYSALLPVGLAVPVLLPVPRWALIPPFHPYRSTLRRSLLCGAFPGVAPAGRYPAPLLQGVRTFLDRPAIRASGAMGCRGHPALRASVFYAAPAVSVNGGAAPACRGRLPRDIWHFGKRGQRIVLWLARMAKGGAHVISGKPVLV